MDYRTLFIFDVVSLAVYATAISVLALRNRKMTGLRWFAVSVLLQLTQTVLQAMRDIWLTRFTVLSSTILVGLSFFAMYMGFHWTLMRRPLRTRLGPICLLVGLAGYAGLYLMHSTFDFAVGMAPVFVSTGLSAGLLLRRGTGHFRTVSRVTFAVLAASMGLTIYRTVVMVGGYGYDRSESGLDDPRVIASMLGLMVMGGALVLMYLWFFVAERWSDLALTARLDPLTGVLNRRAVDDGARREISRAHRSGEPLALLLLDIDHFKKVNDVYGHRAGDEVLRSFVSVLHSELRQVDLLGRIGGEEFVIFLPGTTADSATTLAERLRVAVEAAVVLFEGREIKFTTTLGVTQLLPSEENWEGMLARADDALYKGKREGRNRVMLDRRSISIHISPMTSAQRLAVGASGIRERKGKIAG